MSFASRLFAGLCLAALVVPASAAGLMVTALDHSGFMVSDGKTKILIDALLEKSSRWPFNAPAPDLLGKMEKGEKPFDGVTLMLISHDHEDHYSPVATVRFLESHPKALVVTTPEVLKRLKTIDGFAKVEKQVEAPDLAWKQALQKRFNGVTIELDRLKHGDDKKWACELDAFAFTLGGRKVLYATATGGFFPEEYKELGYANRKFDLAFINYYTAINAAKSETGLNAEGVAMIKELIGAKNTVLMHIQPSAAPSVEAMMPELEKQLPGVVVFKSERDSRTF